MKKINKGKVLGYLCVIPLLLYIYGALLILILKTMGIEILPTFIILMVCFILFVIGIRLIIIYDELWKH